MSNEVQVSRIVMLDDEDTLVTNNIFVPSDKGETCALFLTDDERNMLAKLIVMRSLVNEGDKSLCQSIYAKLPPRV